jgi:hypothetical protein
MANSKQSVAKRLKMSERSQQLKDLHFSGFHPDFLWHRKTNDGFITIPRSLPIVMQAIDAMSKGQPAGHTLLCLWSRSPDNSLLVIENPATFAAEAGFIGERAVDTWRKRMKSLRDLLMIQTKPGPSGEFHYILLVNPNAAIEWMRGKGWVQDGLYARFIDRLMEIGAFGEIEAVRAVWAAEAAQAAQAAVNGNSVPPPPPAEAVS